MNSTRALRVLLGTLLVVALGATGCGEAKAEADESKSATSTTESSSESSTTNIISDEGYPIDRSLTGLVNFPVVDTIVVITAPKIAEPVFIGPAGANTAKGWADAPGDYIVTPVDATVSEVIRGTAKVGDSMVVLKLQPARTATQTGSSGAAARRRDGVRVNHHGDQLPLTSENDQIGDEREFCIHCSKLASSATRVL